MLKKRIIILTLCMTIVTACMTACTSSSLELSPENILKYAYQKDLSNFTETFNIDLDVESSHNEVTKDYYEIRRSANICGKSSNQIFVDFSDNKLQLVVYKVFFEKSKGKTLEEAFDYMKSVVKQYSELYRESILFEHYATTPDVWIGDYESYNDLSVVWERDSDDFHVVAEAFRVSDSCILEITLSSWDLINGVVSLNFYVPVELTLN